MTDQSSESHHSAAAPRSKRSVPAVAVIGSGPAGLMAADVLARGGCAVSLFERRPAPAWKLFVAGGSGLNISHHLPLPAFISHYTGPQEFWQRCLASMTPEDWLAFINKQLGIGTFLGTSQRYFVETMHAAKLVRQWRRRLEGLGVQFFLGSSCSDFVRRASGSWQLACTGAGGDAEFEAVCFALGGGSYADERWPASWPAMFASKGVAIVPFKPANTGYELDWSPAFLREAEGQALKNIELTTARGSRRGDLVITAYGLEGTPIYFMGTPGPAQLDLKPDLSAAAILDRLTKSKENFSPLRRAQKLLGLHAGGKALLFHMAPASMLHDVETMARGIKAFPLQLLQARPLSEAISSQGGIAWEALAADHSLMLQGHPGVFIAGEMIDWDAPTGGFLIQACVSQGNYVAQNMLSYLGLKV